MKNLPSVTEVRDRYKEICILIERVKDSVRGSIISADYYKLPVIFMPSQHDELEVTRTVGLGAYDDAISSFSDLQRHDRQNPNFSVRHPGIIFVHSVPLTLIEEVNACKSALGEILSSMSGAARADFMRDALPGISTHHLTRHIRYLHSTPHRISFTWAASTTITKAITPEEAAQSVLDATGQDALTIQQSNRLASVSGALYRRRAMFPHPRMNILMSKGGGNIMIPATLPLIVPMSPGMAPPIVTPLSTLQGLHEPRTRKVRSDKKELLPVFNGLNIYEEVS